MELSRPQRLISEQLDKITVVSAGAGSGKTRSLIGKFKYLIDKDYDPERILTITFTNKAATELKEKLVALTGLQFHSFPWTRTIHSACLQMLKPFIEKIGYRNPVTIYSAGDQKRIIRSILKDFKLDIREYTIPILQIFSNCKDNSNPRKFITTYISENQNNNMLYVIKDKIIAIFEAYEETLIANNAIDFNDILWYTYDLIKHDEGVRKEYQNLFQYILVDEYQDVNFIQNEIIKLLINNNNLTIVADDYQAIYKWRGSDPSFFINYKDHFPESELYKLEQNYRSSNAIVSLSNALISKNKNQIHKICFSEIPSDAIPTIIRFETDIIESKNIALGCIEYSKLGLALNDIAILYRAKYNSRAIESALAEYGLPYTIIGSVAFFERREIKDIMTYLNFINNPNDVIAFERCLTIPKRGIGGKTIEKIKQESGENILYKCSNYIKSGKISGKNRSNLDQFITLIHNASKKSSEDVINDVIKFTNYYTYLKGFCIDEEDIHERTENIHELISLAKKVLSLQDFIEDCSLLNGKNSECADSIKLMTIHAAKGLEFKAVFVIGLEDGLFPHHRALAADRKVKSKEHLEEERRLFYVAVTRAEILLNITFCDERSCSFAKYPSRFINEIKPFCTIVDTTQNTN